MIILNNSMGNIVTGCIYMLKGLKHRICQCVGKKLQEHAKHVLLWCAEESVYRTTWEFLGELSL